MKTRRQLFIALLILVAGGFSAFAIIKFPPQSGQQEEAITLPFAQFVRVKLKPFRMDVRTHGRVMAHTEIDLIAEVSGNIINVSPKFVSGGFFRKGDMLVKIDPADYDLKVVQAHANVAEARYQLVREEAEAEQAREEWQHLGQGDPTPLNQRIPQLAERRAKLAAEKAALRNAQLLRQRTEIRAPFDGRVRAKAVDVGQYLTRGIVLGTIYSSDSAEVRLPLSSQELAFIDFPTSATNTTKGVHPLKMATVALHAMHLGQEQTWYGYIVRSEGVVDRDTGMMTVIAQVPDPFGRARNRSDTSQREHVAVELPLGLFVEATIEGRWIDDLAILPASVLLDQNHVAVIDVENRIHIRTVEVLKRERERVVINSGLNDGDQVMVSGILRPTEGQQVIPKLVAANIDNSEYVISKELENIDMKPVP